jgi:hypothetical protein
MAGYNAFDIFNDILHFSVDIFWVVITLLEIGIVRENKQLHHLKWLYPTLIACSLTVVYRCLVVIHHLSGTRWDMSMYMKVDILVDLESFWGMWSTIVLYNVINETNNSARSNNMATTSYNG